MKKSHVEIFELYFPTIEKMVAEAKNIVFDEEYTKYDCLNKIYDECNKIYKLEDLNFSDDYYVDLSIVGEVHEKFKHHYNDLKLYSGFKYGIVHAIEKDFWHKLCNVLSGTSTLEEIKHDLRNNNLLKLSRFDKQCGWCAKSVYFEYDADIKSFVESNHSKAQGACPYVDEEFSEYVIDCPSGSMVFGNNFSCFMDYEYNSDYTDYSINGLHGQKRMEKGYAEHNYVYVQVGNTSPSILRNKNTGALRFSIAYDEDTDEREVFPDEEDIGYVCTDLWAVLGMDKDEYDKKVNDYIQSGKNDMSFRGNTVVKFSDGACKLFVKINNYKEFQDQTNFFSMWVL